MTRSLQNLKKVKRENLSLILCPLNSDVFHYRCQNPPFWKSWKFAWSFFFKNKYKNFRFVLYYKTLLLNFSIIIYYLKLSFRLIQKNKKKKILIKLCYRIDQIKIIVSGLNTSLIQKKNNLEVISEVMMMIYIIFIIFNSSFII